MNGMKWYITSWQISALSFIPVILQMVMDTFLLLMVITMATTMLIGGGAVSKMATICFLLFKTIFIHRWPALDSPLMDGPLRMKQKATC